MLAEDPGESRIVHNDGASRDVQELPKPLVVVGCIEPPRLTPGFRAAKVPLEDVDLTYLRGPTVVVRNSNIVAADRYLRPEVIV